VAAAREAARRTGRVALLVSHRFSILRMPTASRYSMAAGSARSAVTTELMKDGGLYAQLRELQAPGYR